MVNYRKRLKMAAAGLTTQNEAAKRQAQKRLNELAKLTSAGASSNA
jgi:hypothetical protein